jgi:hypothetical protein
MRLWVNTFLFIAGKTITPWDNPEVRKFGKISNAYSQQFHFWEIIL